MPKVFDENGNEVKDVITKEDHEKQLADASAKAIADAQAAGTVVSKEEVEKIKQGQTKLEADLKKANEALEAADGKDKNFEALRKAKDAAETKLKEFETGVGAKLADIEKRLSGTGVDEAIATLSEGDEEMAKKIKFHFDRISKSEDTDADRKQKLVDATTLAKGSRPSPSLLTGILGSNSGYSPNDMKDKDGENVIKPELAGMAKKFGISDKDVAKFGSKPLTH